MKKRNKQKAAAQAMNPQPEAQEPETLEPEMPKTEPEAESEQPESPELSAEVEPEAQASAAEPLEGEVTEAEPEGEAEAAPEVSVETLAAALEAAVKQRDELKDSLLRAQADFQNFKRRNATARSDGYQDGVREAITAMLPAIDNLERAIEAARKVEGNEAMVDGVQMTLNTLFEGLKRFGFEEVPALGEDFDPEKHNAVMQESGDEPGKVLAVFQKGYRVKDRIIRYAMVKVSCE